MTEPPPHAGYDDTADSVGRDLPLDLVDLVASSELDGELDATLSTDAGLDQAAVAARTALFRILGEQARAELPFLTSDGDWVGVGPNADTAIRQDSSPKLNEAAQADAIRAALSAGGFTSAPISLAERRRARTRRVVRGAAAAAAIVAAAALAPRLFDKVDRSTASTASSESSKTDVADTGSVTEPPADRGGASTASQADSQSPAAGQSVGSDQATTDSPDASSVPTTIARQGDVTSTVVSNRPVPAGAEGVSGSSPAAQSGAASTDSVAYGPGPTFATPLFTRIACVAGLRHGAQCG